MRKIVSYFIKYPVAANAIILGVFVLGIAGLFTLNSSFFPLNESRNINISVSYPGASPQEMEEGIVLKIEDNIRGLVGVDRFTSTSSENSARIMVEVIKGYDVDVVLADIKNAVDRVPNYPVGMDPPVISKMIFRTEAVSFSVSGENVSLQSLKQIAREVETDLRAIDGISQVEVEGYPAEEIEIAVNEDKLRAYELTFQDVARAVSSTNILVTGGSIKTETEEYLIRVSNRVYHGNELDYIVVKADNAGNKIRLSDIATVRDRWSENPNRSYFNGKTFRERDSERHQLGRPHFRCRKNQELYRRIQQRTLQCKAGHHKGLVRNSTTAHHAFTAKRHHGYHIGADFPGAVSKTPPRILGRLRSASFLFWHVYLCR